ncbi:MAG: hypothetical protein K2W82_01085 [Candidatus Obscuribacterales bacterium]|nr:hypothetical protein [Candidatus Obscuribacterales bacterium]
MKIAFTRIDLNACQTVVTRKDSVVLAVPTHDRPKVTPHDLAHFIIERELGLDHGFWGKAAAGAMFSGMTVIEGQQKPHAKDRSQQAIKDEKQIGVYAEVLVSTILHMALDNLDKDWIACQRELKEMWVPPGVQTIPWTSARLTKICDELRKAKDDWQKLAVGETMHVLWTINA